MEFQAIFKVLVATRQPSEDKEFWHSETVRLILGGVVSEMDEEEEEIELELDDEDDEPASSAGKLEEELSATPVPPPPKPG